MFVVEAVLVPADRARALEVLEFDLEAAAGSDPNAVIKKWFNAQHQSSKVLSSLSFVCFANLASLWEVGLFYQKTGRI